MESHLSHTKSHISQRQLSATQPSTLSIITSELIFEEVQDFLQSLQNGLVPLLVNIAWQVLLVVVRNIPAVQNVGPGGMGSRWLSWHLNCVAMSGFSGLIRSAASFNLSARVRI